MLKCSWYLYFSSSCLRWFEGNCRFISDPLVIIDFLLKKIPTLRCVEIKWLRVGVFTNHSFSNISSSLQRALILLLQNSDACSECSHIVELSANMIPSRDAKARTYPSPDQPLARTCSLSDDSCAHAVLSQYFFFRRPSTKVCMLCANVCQKNKCQNVTCR